MTPQTPSTMRHGSENKKAEQEAHKAKTTIKDWAEDDRPREKLLAKGAKALSTAELLAILIGSGTADKSAVELMRDDNADNYLYIKNSNAKEFYAEVQQRTSHASARQMTYTAS